MRNSFAAAALLAGLAGGPALAGEADIVEATIDRASQGYVVSATIRHNDEGEDHYADAFVVRGPDGTVLGTRTLYHPHVHNQPFTRSLTGLQIPDSVAQVTVAARDNRHGYGGDTVTLQVPR